MVLESKDGKAIDEEKLIDSNSLNSLNWLLCTSTFFCAEEMLKKKKAF